MTFKRSPEDQIPIRQRVVRFIATFGAIASLSFRDIYISGRNMEHLMKSEQECSRIAASSQDWEVVCTRRTLFLGPYCRYKACS